MSTLERIAFYQGRRDEVPNQELARELAEKQDRAGIQEIASHLWDKNANVQSDCLKILYEIGYLDPALIAPYAGDFLKLLKSRNNRMVWGAMIALSTIAGIKADELYPHVGEIEAAIDKGSVITKDGGIKTLAAIAAHSQAYRQVVFPYLLRQLETCRPKDVPHYAEFVATAVEAENREAFIQVLDQRGPEMTSAQAARLKRVVKGV